MKIDFNSMGALWARLGGSAAGRWLFSRLIGFAIPYTGTIGSTIDRLEHGAATVRMRDRRKVRNHLRSVHAISLANLAEFSTGLSVIPLLPAGQNAILVKLEVNYLKKARGEITASARWNPPDHWPELRIERVVDTTLRDSQGDIVCTARATWLAGPPKAPTEAEAAASRSV